MFTRIPAPSRKAFAAFVLLSATLHLLVCKLPVQSSISYEELDQSVIQVTLVSVAAPSIKGNSTENNEANDVSTKTLSEIEPAAGINGDFAKKQLDDVAKRKEFSTSNDNGSDSVTIAPMLSSSDYIQTVPPQYPKRAIDMGQEGVVVIKALITSDGGAKDLLISDSSGYKLLDRSALDAVSKWKFKASALNGKAKEMWVQVPVKFIIR